MVELAEDYSRVIGEALKLSKNSGGKFLLAQMNDQLKNKNIKQCSLVLVN